MSLALMLSNSLVSPNTGATTDPNMTFVEKYLQGTGAPFRASRLKLDEGEDMSCMFIGDSTYRNSASGVYYFATLLAAQYPNHRVLLSRAADNMQSYTTTVVQAGPLGPRYRYYPTGVLRNLTLPSSVEVLTPSATNLLTLEAFFSLEAGALTAGKPTVAHQLGGISNTDNVPIKLILNTNGTVDFAHRNAAGASPSNWPSDAAVAGGTIVADTRYGIRVTYQPTNGANSVINYYTSIDDGANWVQLGTANQLTTASDVTTTATYSYFLGHSGSTPSAGLKIFGFQIRVGTAQKKILPERIDLWRHSTGQTTNATEFGGSPTIYILQAAQDGAAVIDAAGFYSGSGAGDFPLEFYRCVPNQHPDWISIASSHNDSAEAGSQEDWNDAMDAAVTAILGVFQNDPVIIHTTQNPEPLDYADGGLSFQHNRRQKDIILYADRKGRDCTDIYTRFLDVNDPDNAIPGDVHPSSAGYVLWGDTLFRLFKAA